MALSVIAKMAIIGTALAAVGVEFNLKCSSAYII
jgi:hypothetical protein